MPLRILIAPDKFKGTMTAREAAQAIARGWKKVRPRDRPDLLPMSDGGDGFGEIIGGLLGAKPRKVATVDAAHRPLQAHWWWDARSKTAVVESAKAIGLALLPPGKIHPFQLDTFGLGKLLEAAAEQGAERCIIGIGGSATNDGGFGMARSLGWRFLDADDRMIETWTDLTLLRRIVPPLKRRLFKHVTVAVDVRNPLLGKRGATRVYGPQKGLRPEDFPRAEACLRRLAQAVGNPLGKDAAGTPGAGAAGGLGFALMTFLGAQPVPGFDLFARRSNLKGRLREAGLVITGEGAIDRSSVMGKGVGELVELCRKNTVPCVALGGAVSDRRYVSRGFQIVHALTDLTSEKSALRNPKPWLERLSAKAAREWTRHHAT